MKEYIPDDASIRFEKVALFRCAHCHTIYIASGKDLESRFYTQREPLDYVSTCPKCGAENRNGLAYTLLWTSEDCHDPKYRASRYFEEGEER